jgi:hypothetical protein
MDRDEALLRQYEVFSERKLHFGQLFWQIPAVFLGLCVLVANALKDSSPALVGWLLLAAGTFLILIAYIAHRLRLNEDAYEQCLRQIEVSLVETIGSSFQLAPLSRKSGARFWTTIVLAFAGVILISVALIQLRGL